MASPTVGIGVSPDKNVVLTSDSGKTWTKKAVLGFTSPYDIISLGVGSTKKAIVGLDSGGRTYITEDGGLTWSSVKIGANKQVSSIQFIDSLNVYAVLNGNSGSVDTPYVYLSKDAGKTWEFRSKVDSKTWSARIAFDKNQPNVVYLPISSDDSLLYRSTDSARTWTAIKLPFDVSNDNFIYSFGDTTVYTYGGYGEVFYSNDGGQSWEKKFKVPNVFDAKDFIFTAPDKGYMCSYYSGSYDSRLYEISHFGDSLNLIAVEPNAWAYFFANDDPTNFKLYGDNGRFFALNKSGIISSTLSVAADAPKVFPNPSLGSVTISNIQGQTTVSIFALDGKNVFTRSIGSSEMIESTVTLDISALKNGNYVLTVENNNNSTSYQLVKI